MNNKTKALKSLKSFTFMAAIFPFGAIAAMTDVKSTDGWYGSINGGLTFVQNTKVDDFMIKNNPGFNLGVAMGLQTGNFRVEGELRYLRNNGEVVDTSSFHWNTFPFMLNGYYDFNQLSYGNLHPFIGVGLGSAIVNIGGDNIQSDTGNVFAYQAMPGIAYDLNQNVSMDLSYRYLGTSHVFEGQSGTYQSHSINLGLRYRFIDIN